MNTQQYTSWNIPYLYSVPVTDFNVSSIVPEFGPGTWSTQPGYTCCTLLNVSGSGFQDTGGITCKFAATFSDPSIQTAYYAGCTGPEESCDPKAQTPATFISPTLIQCPTPDFTSEQWGSLTTAVIELDVSLNGQNYRRDQPSLAQYAYKTVSFYQSNAPTNCTPTAGSVTGGTEVTIFFGSPFTKDYSSRATCRWAKLYVTTASNVQFGSTLKCSTPQNEVALTSGVLPLTVDLEVSLNGQNYEATTLSYTMLGKTST
jgi:hypothetical protein